VTTFAPVPLAFALVTVVVYVLAVRRVRRGGATWPRLRSWSFLGVGVPLFLAATCGPPAARAHESLWAYVIMIVMLGMITPIFWVWGAPVSLGRAALPPRAARLWAAWWDSHVVRVLTHPLISPPLMLAVPVAVLATSLLLSSLQNAAVFAAVQIALLVVGVLATLPLSDTESPPHRIPHAASAFLAFFELILDAIPGIVLAYTTTLVAGGWYAMHGVPGGAEWAAGDQRAAGATLWVVGELVDLPFMFLVIRRWMRADAEEARRIDAELDAQDDLRAAVEEALLPSDHHDARPAP
jgi:putative copper resistance protein D